MGGGVRLTEGNGREEMMRDVVMADVVQEVTANPAKKRAINGSKRSAQPRPLLLPVVSYRTG